MERKRAPPRSPSFSLLTAPLTVRRNQAETSLGRRAFSNFSHVSSTLSRIFTSKFRICFGAGDKVATRWITTGHHTGRGLGIEPTGAAVHVTGINMPRFVDGKVAESWDNYDKPPPNPNRLPPEPPRRTFRSARSVGRRKSHPARSSVCPYWPLLHSRPLQQKHKRNHRQE